MFVYFVVIVQLLCGCWVGIQPVQSQTKRAITRHNLPQQRLELIFGSQNNGNCTAVSQSLDGNPLCAGTSVLNDGIISDLDGVSSRNTSSWAAELFTLSGESARVILSFAVDSVDHDRMELAVFNCPRMGINSPVFDIYFDSSFRPDRLGVNQPLGNFNTQSQLNDTSCDHLLVFCVRYNTSVDAPSPTRYINLVFPPASQTHSRYVFLGEVTFLNGGSKPCGSTPRPGPAIQVRGTDSLSTLDSATVTTDFEHHDQYDSCMATALTTGVISVIITALLMTGISVAVHFTVYHCVYKPRSISAGHCKPESGGGDADTIVYEVVDEREGTILEMKENDAYSINERVETTLEMRENEAYSVTERVGGQELKRNEAYGVAKLRGSN